MTVRAAEAGAGVALAGAGRREDSVPASFTMPIISSLVDITVGPDERFRGIHYPRAVDVDDARGRPVVSASSRTNSGAPIPRAPPSRSAPPAPASAHAGRRPPRRDRPGRPASPPDRACGARGRGRKAGSRSGMCGTSSANVKAEKVARSRTRLSGRTPTSTAEVTSFALGSKAEARRPAPQVRARKAASQRISSEHGRPL